MAAGPVVDRGRHRVLLEAIGNFEPGPGPGGNFDGGDAVRAVADLDTQAGEVAGGTREIVLMIHPDAQFHEPAGGSEHDAQLPSAIAGAEPALPIGRQTEL